MPSSNTSALRTIVVMSCFNAVCSKAMLQNFKLNTPLLLHTHALFPHLFSSAEAAYIAMMPVRYSQPLGYCSCFGARVCWGWERSPLSKGMQMSRVHLTSFHDPCRPQPPPSPPALSVIFWIGPWHCHLPSSVGMGASSRSHLLRSV